jgi:hypothetical protein
MGLVMSVLNVIISCVPESLTQPFPFTFPKLNSRYWNPVGNWSGQGSGCNLKQPPWALKLMDPLHKYSVPLGYAGVTSLHTLEIFVKSKSRAVTGLGCMWIAQHIEVHGLQRVLSSVGMCRQIRHCLVTRIWRYHSVSQLYSALVIVSGCMNAISSVLIGCVIRMEHVTALSHCYWLF